jgi:hypothetical protein
MRDPEFDARMEIVERTNKRLVRLFMCSESGRYALMYRLGLDRAVPELDLGGPPRNAAMEVAVWFIRRKSTNEEVERFFELVDQQPLPPGIPERE